MKKSIDEFKKSVQGKKIAVLGIGISNKPLIKYLSSFGAHITAFDKSTAEKIGPSIDELHALGVKTCLGENYLSELNGFDMIFKTPGMRFDLPELVVERERGAVVTSEMEVFFELCPAQIFAVTGSDGKTTTTTLIYRILKEEGYNCWLGGNIGAPLLDKVESISETDKVVLELSSFQLHTMKDSPDVAVITNVSPNHLDVHKSYEEYIDAKRNIMLYQNKKGKYGPSKVILNLDNEVTKSMSGDAKGEVTFFSRREELEEGLFLKNGALISKKADKETFIVNADDILIPGLHNVENYLAASAAVIDYVRPESIRKVAVSFPGVEHRIELVREISGVKFYNSSIDSSPSRTIAALNTFRQRVILIAGGKDKGIPYDMIGEPIINKVKSLILIGATAPKIEKAFRDAKESTGAGGDIPVINVKSYEDAVNEAFKNAADGDIILLSPASTSFDMFKNFEERGRLFKDIVNGLRER